MATAEGRTSRDRFNINNSLIEGWIWSSWVLVMSPQKTGACLIARQRNNEGFRIKEDTLIEKINSPGVCGVYELKIMKEGTTLVVYMGCTCRSSVENGFIARLMEYCKHGSHKKDYLNAALRDGYRVYVRYKQSCNASDGVSVHTKRMAERDEDNVLKHIMYPWNLRYPKP